MDTGSRRESWGCAFERTEPMSSAGARASSEPTTGTSMKPPCDRKTVTASTSTGPKVGSRSISSPGPRESKRDCTVVVDQMREPSGSIRRSGL